MKFIVGLVLGVILVPAILYFYLVGGSAPVATTDPDMPFEEFLAHKARDIRIDRDKPKTAPIQPSEANYLAGAELYKQQRGLPRSAGLGEDGDCDWNVSAAAATVQGQRRNRR